MSTPYFFRLTRCFERMIIKKLGVVGMRKCSSIINHQSSINNHQSPFINRPSSIVNRLLNYSMQGTAFCT